MERGNGLENLLYFLLRHVSVGIGDDEACGGDEIWQFHIHLLSPDSCHCGYQAAHYPVQFLLGGGECECCQSLHPEGIQRMVVIAETQHIALGDVPECLPVVTYEGVYVNVHSLQVQT